MGLNSKSAADIITVWSNDRHYAPLSSMWEMKWACLVLSEGLGAQSLCSVNNQILGYLRFYTAEQDLRRTRGATPPCSSLPWSHTHTHTHTLISLFSLEQSFEAKGRLYLAVRIRQGFWQPTFNFHFSFRVLTRFWRDKLSRILKKKFSTMTFIVTYADVSIFYCFSIPKVAYPGILNAFHI